MTDLMRQGFEFTAVGLSIVFGVLVLIACVVALIRKVDTVVSERSGPPVAKAGKDDPNLDELTVVLITAAAMTLLQGRARIRSIHRVHQDGIARSPWSLQGRASLHGMHLISTKAHRP